MPKLSSFLLFIYFYNEKVIYFVVFTEKKLSMCLAGGTTCGYCRLEGNVQRTSELAC